MLFQPNINEEAKLYEESQDWVDYLMRDVKIPVKGIEYIGGAIGALSLMRSLIEGKYIQIPSLGEAFNEKGEYLMIDTGMRHLNLSDFEERNEEP